MSRRLKNVENTIKMGKEEGEGLISTLSSYMRTLVTCPPLSLSLLPASLPLNFALKLLLFNGGNCLYKLSTNSSICA